MKKLILIAAALAVTSAAKADPATPSSIKISCSTQMNQFKQDNGDFPWTEDPNERLDITMTKDDNNVYTGFGQVRFVNDQSIDSGLSKWGLKAMAQYQEGSDIGIDVVVLKYADNTANSTFDYFAGFTWGGGENQSLADQLKTANVGYLDPQMAHALNMQDV
jgi:hypothetical protein